MKGALIKFLKKAFTKTALLKFLKGFNVVIWGAIVVLYWSRGKGK